MHERAGARAARRSAGRPCTARTAACRGTRTSPIVNSWPTSAFRSMPARDHVAAVLAGLERRVERLAHLGLDHRQRAARLPRGNVPGAGDVAVALESLAGERVDRLAAAARALPPTPATGERLDGADAPAVRSGAAATPARCRRPRRGTRPRSTRARPRPRPAGIPHHARRHAVHHDEPAAGPRDPRSRPRERSGVGDPREPEAEPAEPARHRPAGRRDLAGGRHAAGPRSGSSRIVARQARNEAVSSGSSDSGGRTSRIARDCGAPRRGEAEQPRPAGAMQNDQRADEDDQVADAEHVADRPRTGHRDHVAEEGQVRREPGAAELSNPAALGDTGDPQRRSRSPASRRRWR